MEPQIQYAHTQDGVNIAYAVMGEGVPLVYASNVIGDLRWYTHNEATREQIDTLIAAGCRVVRYDMRGMGSSDREVNDFSVRARVLDLEAVVDSLEIDRFTVCGYAHGNAAAITYARDHGDRVSRLVLVNPYASGNAYYEKLPAAGAMIALRSVAERDWRFFTLTLASAMADHRDPEAAKRTAGVFRDAVSPAVYFAFADAARDTVLTESLNCVDVPTLVLVDSSATGQADLAKAVAALIPGARLAMTKDYIPDLLAFLGLEVPDRPEVMTRAASRAESGTAIILFADIVESTALTERIGDAAFRAKARDLDSALRRIISEAGGTTIEGKLVGDGVLATFAAASQAIDAALRCGALGSDAGLPLHLGLHAGDVIREQNNVFGGAVNVASRISGLSAPGEVLVSDIVRGLARTSAGVTFEGRGEFALKGIEDAQRLYAVRPKQD